jgi:NAD(P)-dependent dehydrogenase (short-subunit alcohol dehydrogenase family)
MSVAELNNKIVFITGAGAGIGLESVKAFADAGCTVIASDMSAPALETLAAEMKTRNQPCHTYQLDVSDREAYLALAEKVVAEIGCPDVLMNNAGVGYMGCFEDTSPEMWQLTLDVNIMGVVNGCEAFLPTMKAAGTDKQIVNVASLASRAPAPNMSAYAASKFAVEGLSKVMDMELADTRVGITCVHPAVIDTAIVRNEKMMSANISDKQIQQLRTHYTQHGCHPSVVAQDVVKAVRRGTFSLYTGPQASATTLAMRLTPWSMARRAIMKTASKMGYL